jgi:hypothetical protein
MSLVLYATVQVKLALLISAHVADAQHSAYVSAGALLVI